MGLSHLTAISPIDGRYFNKTYILQQYFSESALIKYRIQVEIEYFIALCNSSIVQLKHFPKEKFKEIRNLYLNFEDNDAIELKKSSQ